ncbi:MAG TPA: prenyltransferase/squalene oxidase repeat-containing protein [Acidobacteriota bacterium]|nr:prenyltransferase/squalene oxidase repeat-containing protein [Acidobacteriota bacterium]
MKRGRLILACALALLCTPLPASGTAVSEGVDWLVANQDPSGFWGVAGGTPLRDATVVVDLLARVGGEPSAINSATDAIFAANTSSHDYLARKIIALTAAGESLLAADLAETLAAAQNEDGSWGFAEGYAGSVLETALAVRALHAADYADMTTIILGVDYLVFHQNVDGGWSFIEYDSSTVFHTAHTIVALAPLLDTYAVAGLYVEAGVDWLKTQPHGDGGFGTGGVSNPYETGLALAAIAMIEPAAAAVANARTYLEANQLPNGSWNDDAYTTAMALYGLIQESGLFSRGVSLAPGLNLLGLPVAPPAPMMSPDLCSLIPDCGGVTGWDRVGQDWLTGTFEVAVQDATFVQTSSTGNVPLVGTLLSENQCDVLEEGLNAISVPNENACYTAATLIGDISGCEEAHLWDQNTQQWQSLVRPDGDTLSYGVDFAIDLGRGYFIRRPLGAGATSWCTQAYDTITPPETYPDLLITIYDIYIAPNPVMPSSPVMIAGLIHNIGSDTAFTPTLDFFLGDPDAGGSYMGWYDIPEDIPPGQSTTAFYGNTWTFTGCGTGEIYLVVDIDDLITELSEDNNTAHETLHITCPPSASDGFVDLKNSGITDISSEPTVSAPASQGAPVAFELPTADDFGGTTLGIAVAPAISDVTVGSVTSSSAIVSWITDSLAVGCVNYGSGTVGEYSTCESEWWGGQLHYVELNDLASATTYVFEVVSDETTDNNGGAYYTFTTSPVGAGAPGTVYGRVMVDVPVETQKSDPDPPKIWDNASQSIVTATLATPAGSESSPLTVMADGDGLWVINLGNLKNAASHDVMEYAAGDTVRLVAQSGLYGTGEKTIVLSGDYPEDAGAIVVSDCACDCFADPGPDPVCDGVTNIVDAVLVVDVAFRGGSARPDPNPACPYETTDVTCDGLTTIIDAVRVIDVAFRGGDPAALFCDPCAP